MVLVGTRVARAFGIESPEFFEWTRREDFGFNLVVIPHPSGVNLWWNKKENKERGTKFLRELGEGWRALREGVHARKSA